MSFLDRHKFSLLLIALCFLVYANSLNNAFISDDVASILENPKISEAWRFWTDPSPFLDSLNYHLVGFQPFTYHLSSIILHSLNTILVFLFLQLFFKLLPSFLGASLFAVHPIHTEAVTWISGKPYLFLALFILTVYFFYYYATYQAKFKPWYYVLSFIGFSYYLIDHYSFFALTPLLLVLSDITFTRWRKNWKLWLPFIAIVILRIILARNIITHRISYIENETGLYTMKNSFVYLVYSFYAHLGLLFWPVRLTFYHEPIVIYRAWLNYGLVSLFIIVIPVLFLAFKKARELFFALGIFILFLAPTYSPVPVSSLLVAERYLYFPSLALSIFVAFVYERYSAKYARARKYLLGLLILILVACAIRTVLRNEDWKSPGIFWRKTVEVSHKNSGAHNNMGFVYFKEGKVKEAIKEFEKAIEINPQYDKAYNNLGAAYAQDGDIEKAIVNFQKAIKINPRSPDAYNNLALLYNRLGGREKAMDFSGKAIDGQDNLRNRPAQ